MLERLGREFARFTTNQVVRRPRLWPLFRWLTRAQFNRIAPAWDQRRSPEAFLLAGRYPEAEVVGVDLAEDMLAEARRLTPPELADRVRFERADAERLSYPDGSFDLVSLANMIPFFQELARITAPGGAVVFSFSAGPETPIYVPPEVLRARLGEHGFAEFADFAAGNGTALSARKRSEA
jgi:SAM-dependent methyltransferase